MNFYFVLFSYPLRTHHLARCHICIHFHEVIMYITHYHTTSPMSRHFSLSDCAGRMVGTLRCGHSAKLTTYQEGRYKDAYCHKRVTERVACFTEVSPMVHQVKKYISSSMSDMYVNTWNHDGIAFQCLLYQIDTSEEGAKTHDVSNVSED